MTIGRWAERIPGKREAEMFQQRTVEGLTLREIADAHGLHCERVRQLLKHYYGLTGYPPAAKERRKQKARRRGARSQSEKN